MRQDPSPQTVTTLRIPYNWAMAIGCVPALVEAGAAIKGDWKDQASILTGAVIAFLGTRAYYTGIHNCFRPRIKGVPVKTLASALTLSCLVTSFGSIQAHQAITYQQRVAAYQETLQKLDDACFQAQGLSDDSDPKIHKCIRGQNGVVIVTTQPVSPVL